MDYAILCIAGMISGWYLNQYVMLLRVKKLVATLKTLQTEEDKLVDQVEKHSLQLRMEHVDGTFLFYDKKNGNFITQAKTKEDLMLFLNQFHSDKYIFITQEDLDILDKA
jgi:hypothetical protein